MPASKKDGGKNRKFGRHSRNPSSKLYPNRYAANAAKRIARHCARMGISSPASVPCPKHPAKPEPKAFVIFSGVVMQHRGPWYACMLNGRILSCGSLNEAAHTRSTSSDPRTYIVRRDGSVMNRIEV